MKSLLLLASALLLLGSCAHNNSASTGWAYNENLRQADSYGNPAIENKKVIFSASIHLTVKNTEETADKIASMAKAQKGYVVEKGTYKCIIRVPSNALDSTVSNLTSLGRVDSKSMTGRDVTEDYLDYEIRLKNAEKARDRYLELLAKAENVTAALKVEKELERLNETIELYKGKMNRVDHLVSYSTISVYFKEKKKPGVLGYVGIGVYKGIKWLFVRN